MNRKNLTAGTFGDDIARLHERLKALGEIPAMELQRQFFGPGTRAALIRLQATHGLPESGEVDAQTAATLELIMPTPEALTLPRVTGEVDPTIMTLGARLETPISPSSLTPTTIAPPRDHQDGLAAALTERAVSRLLPLLKTSPSLTDTAKLERFARLVADRRAFQPAAWAAAASEAGLLPAQIEEVRLTLELGRLAGDHWPLVKQLQSLRSARRISHVSDLVQWGEQDLQALLRRAPGAADAAAQSAISALNAQLRQTYPMAFIRKAVAVQPAIDWNVVRGLLAANPALDPLAWEPKTTDLRRMEPAQRSTAQAAVAALRHEIRAYPDFDWRAALNARDDHIAVNQIRRGIARFLDQAPEFDMRTQRVAAFVSLRPDTLQGVELPAHVVTQLQRMQRVYRVAPDAEALHALMGEGLHSAFAIVRIPADVFVARLGAVLAGDESAARIYAAARGVSAVASSIAWTARLRSAGPLPAAVGMWPPPELQIGDSALQKLLQPQTAALRQALISKNTP